MNPKISIIVLLICYSYINTLAQTTIIFHPDSESGKDAIISCYEPDKNFGNHPDFFASAWTKSGSTLNVRSLIEFDLGIIAKKTKILSAKLSLYSHQSPSNGSHSTLGGSNSCYLQKITSEWNEATITWNNQPTASNKNIVILPYSQNSIQHYLNIDITEMVQDMVDNPAENFGFMLMLEKEERYRKMLFASSDHQDTNLHPSLTIIYENKPDDTNLNEKNDFISSDVKSDLIMKSPNGNYWRGRLTNKGNLKFEHIQLNNDFETDNEIENSVSIFYNNNDNYLTIRDLNNKNKKAHCKIYTKEGILIKENKIRNYLSIIDFSKMNKGKYEVKVSDKQGNIIAQQIIQKK